jgi:hypothetical protein
VAEEFAAGRVSGDGGALLLREVEKKIKLLGRSAECFTAGRDPNRVEHLAGVYRATALRHARSRTSGCVM